MKSIWPSEFPCAESELHFSASIQSANQGFILRLDPCSAKDSVDFEVPTSAKRDIVFRLVTSVRARKTLQAYLGSIGEGNSLVHESAGLACAPRTMGQEYEELARASMFRCPCLGRDSRDQSGHCHKPVPFVECMSL